MFSTTGNLLCSLSPAFNNPSAIVSAQLKGTLPSMSVVLNVWACVGLCT